MSTATLINDSQNCFSESFLSYLSTGINKNEKTYCEDKGNKYHDSSYIWCRTCDKIFCTQCSMNHLINNQINHCPIEQVFLRKEHFDVEFTRDFEKLKELRDKIISFFNKKKSECSLNKINSLKEALDKIKTLSNELMTDIITKFIQKYNESINNLLKSLKDVKVCTLNEDKMKIRFQELFNKFKKIEKDYTKNEKFEPKMLKPYYEDLINSYREIHGLNELLDNNTTNNNNSNNKDNKDANKEYEHINSNLQTTINILNTFKLSLKKI